MGRGKQIDPSDICIDRFDIGNVLCKYLLIQWEKKSMC